MSFILIDGFDLYNGDENSPGFQTKWVVATGSDITFEPGRFGGKCLHLGDGSGSDSPEVQVTFPVGHQSFALGFAVKLMVLPGFTGTSSVFLFSIDDAGTVQLRLSPNADGSLALFRGTTLIATSLPGALVNETWRYVEVFGTIDDVAGHVEVWAEGTQVLSFDGDTQNSVNASFNQFKLKGPNGSGGGNACYYDDLYMTNTAVRVGTRRIEVVRPTADTVDKDFVPSTGTDNFAMIDDDPINTADYVSGSVVGDFDLYELGSLSTTPSSIDAVQVTSFASRTDIESRSIALVANSGGVESQSTDKILNPEVNMQNHILDLDPNGNVPWTKTAIDALKAGFKITV